MIRNLYFKDGVLFASGYERIVHGERGNYVELTKEQIVVKLVPLFNQVLPDKIIGNESFYYYWCKPENREEKIYWQSRIVNYADYKIGYYYISPKLLKSFKANELF